MSAPSKWSRILSDRQRQREGLRAAVIHDPSKAESARVYLSNYFAERMSAAIQSKGEAVWGPWRLIQTGIVVPGTTINWSDITRIRINDNGFAVITATNGEKHKMSIDSLNFWPGYVLLQDKLDPAVFASKK